MIPLLSARRWFAFGPTPGTIAAIVTALIMTCGGYYLLVHLSERSPVRLAYRIVFGLLPVIFPVWWICHYRNQPLREPGITWQQVKPSLVISIIITLVFLFFVFCHFSSYGAALIPHFVLNAIILREPFFLFAWLPLRFDRAFGIISGIFLTGVCPGAYHIGTYELPLVLSLMASGIVFAAIFRITENILNPVAADPGYRLCRRQPGGRVPLWPGRCRCGSVHPCCPAGLYLPYREKGAGSPGRVLTEMPVHGASAREKIPAPAPVML